MHTQLLSQEEKRKQLKISRKTMYNWIKNNKIEYIKIPNSKRKWFLP